MKFITYRNLLALFGPSLIVFGGVVAGATRQDVAASRLASGSKMEVRRAVDQIRDDLRSDPVGTVDRLNESLSVELLRAGQYEAVDEFATLGTLAVPADTWRIEQLQKHRIEALLAEHKPQEALRAAKGLFNACGMGFTKDALSLLAECLKAAYPDQPQMVARFKLQVLANAQQDPAERARLAAKYGGNSVMDSMSADAAPYLEALKNRTNATDYRGLYGTGNLLLLSGRLKEAHQAFKKVYLMAPPGELKYASEGVAKMIKAEEAGLGKANQFVRSLQPKM